MRVQDCETRPAPFSHMPSPALGAPVSAIWLGMDQANLLPLARGIGGQERDSDAQLQVCVHTVGRGVMRKAWPSLVRVSKGLPSPEFQ